MITLTVLSNRLADTAAAISRHSGTDIETATNDIVHIAAHLGRAHTVMLENTQGIPSSMGGGGTPTGVSDPTGRAILTTDPASSALEELDRTTERMVAHARNLHLGRIMYGRRLVTETGHARRIVENWDRPTAARWCTHCTQVNAYKAPVAQGRYKELCRKCGDWRAVNGVLPPRDVLGYLQVGDPVPERVLDRHHAVVPNGKRRKKRNLKK